MPNTEPTRMARFHFCLAGIVERGNGSGYSWVTKDGPCQPWMLRREAQQFARTHGGKAVFHPSEAAARLAAQAEEG